MKNKAIKPFHSSTVQHVKAYAFTLAETLIVIGILGVVAALTLPNLNHATGDKERVTRLRKVYSSLTEAYDRAEANYGSVDEWFKGTSNNTEYSSKFAGRMKEFLKVSKDCGFVPMACTSDKVHKLLDGTAATEDTSSDYSVMLSDGMSLTFHIESSDCATSYVAENVGAFSPSAHVCGYVVADLDGPKGANVLGKDSFSFFITQAGIYPVGTSSDALGFELSKAEPDWGVCWSKQVEQNACAGWVLEYENLDYLKADSSGKCPNDITLSATNTSCH